jgi:hypothetical protein
LLMLLLSLYASSAASLSSSALCRSGVHQGTVSFLAPARMTTFAALILSRVRDAMAAGTVASGSRSFEEFCSFEEFLELVPFCFLV